MLIRSIGFFLVSSLLACGSSVSTSILSEGKNPLEEGTPEAFGVLDLVNSPNLTLDLLDDDVGLDRRAATNIYAFRVGPDDQLNTSDDETFANIAELDGISYVGNSALTKLLAYAQEHGFVQEPDPNPTTDEAAILALVNHESITLELLDDDVGLDNRAARNIMAYRTGADATLNTPDDQYFPDVETLDAIPYVGQSALNKLLVYSMENEFGEETQIPEEEEEEQPELSQDDLAILAVVNHETITFEMLDEGAGLDNRAATNIMAYRMGPDGLRNTADDQYFPEIATLDALPYVGQSALAKLLAYSLFHGFGGGAVVPEEEEEEEEEEESQPCLIISEYIEGQGNYNKAVELYNCGSEEIDLGEINLCKVRNSATTCGSTVELTPTQLAPGQTWMTCKRISGTFNDPFQPLSDACDQEVGDTVNFNGNDRLVLYWDADGDGQWLEGGDDLVMDMFGQPQVEPAGYPWADVNLRRCDLTPYLGDGPFDAEALYTVHTRHDFSNYGIAPTGDCQGTTTGQAGDDCEDDQACADDLRCFGIPFDGSGDVGKCVATAGVPGQGDSCGQGQPCSGGNQCAGFTLWGEGTCVAPWMAGSFSATTSQNITPNATTSSSVVVYGLATVPVDITLTVNMEHPSSEDLVVTLTDPNGDSAVLWQNASEIGGGMSRSFVTSGISRDDTVNGRWTLDIASSSSDAGTLVDWDLFIVSQWD